MKKLFELLSNLGRKEEGMTGPAMAIVLASFIIVGSSVAFGVLNAGSYSSQQVEDTLMASLDSILGSVQTRGATTVIDVDDDGAIDESDRIEFDIAIVPGGNPVLVDPAADTGSIIINYADAQDRVPGIAYSVAEISGDGDNLLETGELFEITVKPPGGSRLAANETFGLEIIPPQGAVLTINRTMPPVIDRVMTLH
ncbi:MAG: flagellin [Dehalococcoidia bacterium]|nr:flagellin [Dehalococcoidia bacterium]